MNDSSPVGATIPSLIKTQLGKVDNAFGNIQEEIGRNFVADSHDLALQDQEIKGEIQKQAFTGVEVKDLGWHKDPTDMPDILIGGITNDRVFGLIRRFNKVNMVVKVQK